MEILEHDTLFRAAAAHEYNIHKTGSVLVSLHRKSEAQPSVTQEGAIQAIQLCLDYGLEINAFNNNGLTAIHRAAARERRPRQNSGPPA